MFSVVLLLLLFTPSFQFTTTPNKAVKPYQNLLSVCHEACKEISDLVNVIYEDGLNSDIKMEKADNSAFTIADALVQYLLEELLSNKVGSIVGEEDSIVRYDNIKKTYMIDNLELPLEFVDLVTNRKKSIQLLRDVKLDSDRLGYNYNHLTAFLDPIDGTKEFISSLGEMCTICIGFSDTKTGKAVAGIVYRPITNTWAAGAESEDFCIGELDVIQENFNDNDVNINLSKETNMFVTTRGKISPFTEILINKLGKKRFKIGGAGNKVLSLLEGKGDCYIQDRGLNRWDTCACEAVLESFGGCLCRLDRFVEDGELVTYTYQTTDVNLDYQKTAQLTKYNSRSGSVNINVNVDEINSIPSVSDFKPYSNICGLIALAPHQMERLGLYKEAILATEKETPPKYD